MNRVEVIMTIEAVGNRFAKVMASLCSTEYVQGYRRALSDMTRVFGEASLDPDFEAERTALYAEIKRLRTENDMLKRDCGKQHTTIEELLKHVDLHEVLGIGDNSRKSRGVRR